MTTGSLVQATGAPGRNSRQARGAAGRSTWPSDRDRSFGERGFPSGADVASHRDGFDVLLAAHEHRTVPQNPQRDTPARVAPNAGCATLVR